MNDTAARLARGLLAQDAATAGRTAGKCSLCSLPILTYQRYAALVPSAALAHLPCIAAAVRRRAPLIR